MRRDGLNEIRGYEEDLRIEYSVLIQKLIDNVYANEVWYCFNFSEISLPMIPETVIGIIFPPREGDTYI